ncbi:NAD-dependent epimerase/dehydratase family protein [Novosphingobium sp. UBA1939]|uniref:NAD-dependent epimerase/dehydratase family protein n=1 Tax=Novosphingobium sp. UBA1939 TaxID=1946982 RepID=UPI0025F94952|nr:NAD-dependent epimerase/dehydratase family protein [Novosphingobium sp. UBA1939]
MARILLSGATGFLGWHLFRHLTAMGNEVFGTSNRPRNEASLLYCDICDPLAVEAVFQQVQPDIVIHCAAISSVTSSVAQEYYRVNTVGTENVVNSSLARTGKIRFIFISTAGVYGNQETDRLHENLCPKPVHHYGMSKFCAEQIIKNYADQLDYTIIRPFNIIGVGQSGEFIMPKLVTAFHERQPVVKLGNIQVFRDYIDVSDACELIARVTFNPAAVGEVCNLCTGKPVSIETLLNTLTDITGHEIKPEVDPAFVRKNEVWRLLGDTAKLSSLTGGAINGMNLEQSLRRMLAARGNV